MNKVCVKLFALAAELAGGDSIEVAVPPGSTIADLRSAMIRQRPELAEIVGQAMFAIDATYASDERVVPSDAEVACIPPVSGG